MRSEKFMIINVDDEKISEGLSIVGKYLYQSLQDRAICLSAVRAESSRVTLEGGKLTIEYVDRSDFYAALGIALAAEGDFSLPVTKKIRHTGVMLDCARNAVIRPEQAKKMIVDCALLGYDYFELYVEDCFEVDDEPCFGYMRGRFTKEELKELDGFAALFGVELVPCIQTLAHLARIFFHWKEYTMKIQDKGDVLLVGEERTYRLIENMIRTCRECFSSNNINIGMDEAFDLGQGKYFEKHGYVPKNQIIREHLGKVVEICKKYGFRPSMWADMFYENLKKGEYDKVSKDARLVFWEYWCTDKKYYDEMFGMLEKSGADFAFAGGATKWISFAPHNKESEIRIKTQFESATRHNVNDYLLTCWGDDGAEAAHFSVLPCFCYFAMLNLGMDEDYLQKVCLAITGYTHDEFCMLDIPNEPRGKNCGMVNPCKYLLYEDVFIGGEEYSTQPDYPQGYAECAKKLALLAERGGDYAYLFETMSKLCGVLSVKSSLSPALDEAYKSGDRQKLAACLKEMKKAIDLTDSFSESLEKQWLYESKALGLEVMQIRLAGVRKRLCYAAGRVEDYLAGKTDKIEELEEKKLFITDPSERDENYDGTCFVSYLANVTYGRI